MSQYINVNPYKKEIIKLYQDNVRVQEIANKFRVHRDTIRNKLKEWKVPRRPHAKFLSKDNNNWKGFNLVPGVLLSKCKHSAKSRNIIFDITAKDIWNIYIKQNYKCALSGDKLIFEGNLRNVSIDRINSKDYYYIDNCQLVTINVNLAKQSLSDQDFIRLCKKVTNHQKSKCKVKNKSKSQETILV